jgi:hypothetical protein
MRYEKAKHGITVGTTVSILSGGRKFFGVVRELAQYEGGGLVTEGALLRVDGRDWPCEWVGWGAVSIVGQAVSR